MAPHLGLRGLQLLGAPLQRLFKRVQPLLCLRLLGAPCAGSGLCRFHLDRYRLSPARQALWQTASKVKRPENSRSYPALLQAGTMGFPDYFSMHTCAWRVAS